MNQLIQNYFSLRPEMEVMVGLDGEGSGLGQGSNPAPGAELGPSLQLCPGRVLALWFLEHSSDLRITERVNFVIL